MTIETVTIASREFRIGARYQAKPKPGVDPGRQRVRTLLRIAPGLHERLVVVASKDGREEYLGLEQFARWAGEEIVAAGEGR